MNNAPHIPAMLVEVIHALQVKENQTYVDATFGFGGHSKEIMKKGGKVIGFDHDRTVIEQNTVTFEKEISAGKLTLIHDSFEHLADHLQEKVAGILFDFGVNSQQIDDASRGFSFQHEGPLDMRMDDRLSVKAQDLIAALGRKELANLFFHYAQESFGRKIADAIVDARKLSPITTTRQLTEIIHNALERDRVRGIDSATKVFMALRIAVNDELRTIERTLPTSLDCLAEGGHIVTIAFHEGEDRIVKNVMKDWEIEKRGFNVFKKPLTPTNQEMYKNPRARSAKLRAFVKNQYKGRI
ncbi:MAG: S-adenosyl-L-methionine-dependent methyltransferase MraW [Microgenomates group bacterium GW2011_GWF2_45_18]|nr:MAG: S-adenosyl-L-methionine-dependent methyltransferase MraW [Microgenomates group bacterium GW2011_GWF2_45_18]OGJ41681.1 MAG: 16S rRNA (cytosine(1402)-N(4))-methyltransferase [Candidatus Pacebacteria bacterium RIFOXYB1_FULL_44_10]